MLTSAEWLSENSERQELALQNIPLAMELYAKYRETEQSKWISVTERLPERGVPVLLWVHNSWMAVGKLDKVFKDEFVINALCFTEHITHWQPLPSPPKTEQDKISEIDVKM